MPSISKGSVLVTGANGFIAEHCVAQLLSSGFKVIGTVRSESKATSVLKSHSSHPNLSLQIVPDVTKPGCFDTAIKGCDVVLHLAAPFGYAYKDFESELLMPSINGILRICEAAQKEAGAQRVVLTSSFASVYDASKGLDPGKTYTEADWCPLTYEDGKNGAATSIAYRASKVLAEKTAWEFVEKNEVKWDLVTLCPGMVFASLFPGTISSLTELNTSNGIVWSLFDAKAIPDTKAPIWTSVTALAAAHVKALTTPKASNERFLVTDGVYDMQQLADILHDSAALSAAAKKRIPIGIPGKRLAETHYKVDNGKATKTLGIGSPSLEDTVNKLVQQLLELEQSS